MGCSKWFAILLLVFLTFYVSYVCWDIFHNPWAVAVLAILGIIGITVLIYRLKRRGIILLKRVKGELGEYLDNRFSPMSGFEFESFIAQFFQRQGYSAELTPASRDYGVDIVLKKAGKSTAIQVKRYQDCASISSPMIRDLNTGKQMWRCDKALFITTSSFTRDAKETARMLGIELWEWDRLQREIRRVMDEL